MRRFAVGVTTDSHPLYGPFMKRLTACIFEWDASDVARLKEAKRSTGCQPTAKELAKHCHRCTRGTQETKQLIEKLLKDFMGATDTMCIRLLDQERRQEIWQTQQRHIECIQDPPGVQLYRKTGQVTKGGVILPVYRCARGSTSLESFHLHLNRFVPGISASVRCVSINCWIIAFAFYFDIHTLTFIFAISTHQNMDFKANFRREASGELMLKPSAEAAALATAYRKNPTPGRSWPAASVKEEAMARVAAAGGDTGIWQLVLSESALQFGQYRGKTFKWLLSNDVGYAAMVLASHRQERERGDTSTAPVIGNKDALLKYAGLFPDVMAAIQERQVREGSEFGNYATLTFKDLYDAKNKDRKGFIRWMRQKKDIHPGTKMDSLQKYIKRRDAEKLQPNLPKTAPPAVASSSASTEEPSDAYLLAAAAHIDVVAFR